MTANAWETYLSDHMARTAAGRELAAQLMPDVALEMEADQAVLDSVAQGLGVRKHRRHAKGDGVHDLLTLEKLELSIAEKLQMWRALKQAVETEPALRDIDVDHLIDRAVKQLHDVERERLRKVSQLFAAPVTVRFG